MLNELLLTFVLFTFTFWLGGYLIARNPAKTSMLFAGFGLIAYAVAISINTFTTRTESNTLVLVQRAVSLMPAVLWVVSLVLLFRQTTDDLPRRPLGLIIISAVFFGLSLVLLIADVLPRFWALSLIGADVALLGFAVARLDAFDEGESLLPDFVRSLLASGVMALGFGGAVAVAATANNGWSLPMLILMFVVLALAVDTQLFAPRIQTLLDRLVLPPRMQQSRAELREVSEALPRANDALDLNALDEMEFARLTRRALSHMTDLPKLAASPLTRLPAIDRHLAQHGLPDNPLDRASALKAILTQHIAKLKPDAAEFGTSDAWRHYNALHFPYVVGLKPYSVRANSNGYSGHNGHEADAATRSALEWFQSAVPERTLHNWQTAAANLIAQQLRTPAPSPSGRGSRDGSMWQCLS